MIKHKQDKTPHDQNKKKVARISYSPISDALTQENTLADNEFHAGLKRFKLDTLLSQSMSKERRSDAVELSQILITLLVWPVLRSNSIHCFCSELCQYIKKASRKLKRSADVIYDFWGREDINWRKFATKASVKISKHLDLGNPENLAFVVDDSLKPRRGKKVEATSLHHDHNSGKTLQGHQLLELGIVGEGSFVPVDRQIFTGSKNAIQKPKEKDFVDKRCASAQDMKRAQDEDKNQMLKRMLKLAIKNGFKARYLLADAWFGIKRNIDTAIELGLTAIFQMKRGKLKYRYNGKDHTAKELYVKFQRQMKASSKNALYKTVKLEVEINLETKPKAPERWQKVAIILSAPQRTKHENWVLFLTTDLSLTAQQVLEVYSKRWSIEVYFKEVKQHFGLLSEQSGKYQVAYASVHLAAVRYLLIYEAMHRNGSISFGEQRDLVSGKLLIISFASLLWKLFRSLITGALGGMKYLLEPALIEKLVGTMDEAIEGFLNEAFHMTDKHIKIQQELADLDSV